MLNLILDIIVVLFMYPQLEKLLIVHGIGSFG